jgi:hypothetical protein
MSKTSNPQRKCTSVLKLGKKVFYLFVDTFILTTPVTLILRGQILLFELTGPGTETQNYFFQWWEKGRLTLTVLEIPSCMYPIFSLMLPSIVNFTFLKSEGNCNRRKRIEHGVNNDFIASAVSVLILQLINPFVQFYEASLLLK